MKSEDMLNHQEKEFKQKLDQLQLENGHLESERNFHMDKCLKIEETIDEKNERITQLEKEYQRKCDEADLRKEVIDSMSQSLMQQETTQRELATKLVMMKNQIIENDAGKSIGRKFGAVKLGLMNVNTPVAVRKLLQSILP